MESNNSEPTVSFKKKTRPKGLVKRKRDDDNDEDKGKESVSEDAKEGQSVEELREMQRIKRMLVQNRGINVATLEKSKKDKSITKRKEFYGITDAKALVAELDLGNTFSVETNRRDEDAETAKFIEEELAKRKGLQKEESKTSQTVISSLDDLVYNELPSNLLSIGGSKKNEEMLSSQMLSGIPEVDLGLDEKIRNIEATEEAKRKRLEEKVKAAQSGDKRKEDLIPSNIAVNFNLVTRRKVQELKTKSQQLDKVVVNVVEEPVVVLGDEPRPATFTEPINNEKQLKHPGHLKASDDYHLAKFKKQFRKK